MGLGRPYPHAYAAPNTTVGVSPSFLLPPAGGGSRLPRREQKGGSSSHPLRACTSQYYTPPTIATSTTTTASALSKLLYVRTYHVHLLVVGEGGVACEQRDPLLFWGGGVRVEMWSPMHPFLITCPGSQLYSSIPHNGFLFRKTKVNQQRNFHVIVRSHSIHNLQQYFSETKTFRVPFFPPSVEK